MPNTDWEVLNNFQVGAYAEAYARMEFMSYGFYVYDSEVDDHGVDFVIKDKNNKYYDIQVKSFRSSKTSYVFVKEDKFDRNRDNLFMCLIMFENGLLPRVFILPAALFEDVNQNDLVRIRDYKDGIEFGLNVSKKNMYLLECFEVNQDLSKHKVF